MFFCVNGKYPLGKKCFLFSSLLYFSNLDLLWNLMALACYGSCKPWRRFRRFCGVSRIWNCGLFILDVIFRFFFSMNTSKHIVSLWNFHWLCPEGSCFWHTSNDPKIYSGIFQNPIAMLVPPMFHFFPSGTWEFWKFFSFEASFFFTNSRPIVFSSTVLKWKWYLDDGKIFLHFYSTAEMLA